MTDLQVEFDVLDQTTRVLREAHERIVQTLATLDAASSVLESRWSGAAQRAYVAARAEWSAELDRMTVLLADAGSALGAAGSAYRETEQRNAARWPLG